MNKMDVAIVAVKADQLPPSVNDTGFYPCDWGGTIDHFQMKVWLGNRGQLEQDSNFRQLIPYIIMKSGDKYLTYVRGGAGGEDRLHGKLSIGLGGHIDAIDVNFTHHSVQYQQYSYIDFEATVWDGALRELAEEVTFRKSRPIFVPFDQFKGILIDNENEVGKVHLGLVFVIDIGDVVVTSNEPEINELQRFTAEELLAAGDRLEGWSRIFLTSQK